MATEGNGLWWPVQQTVVASSTDCTHTHTGAVKEQVLEGRQMADGEQHSAHGEGSTGLMEKASTFEGKGGLQRGL
jgi:hypothetical protein